VLTLSVVSPSNSIFSFAFRSWYLLSEMTTYAKKLINHSDKVLEDMFEVLMSFALSCFFSVRSSLLESEFYTSY